MKKTGDSTCITHHVFARRFCSPFVVDFPDHCSLFLFLLFIFFLSIWSSIFFFLHQIFLTGCLLFELCTMLFLVSIPWLIPFANPILMMYWKLFVGLLLNMSFNIVVYSECSYTVMQSYYYYYSYYFCSLKKNLFIRLALQVIGQIKYEKFWKGNELFTWHPLMVKTKQFNRVCRLFVPMNVASTHTTNILTSD